MQPTNAYKNSATAYVKINAKDSAHPIIVSDAIKHTIYFINKNLQATDSITESGSVVDIDFNKENKIACDIGVLNPNNGKFGKGYVINSRSNGQILRDSNTLITDLQRPVQITGTDLNNDGKTGLFGL